MSYHGSNRRQRQQQNRRYDGYNPFLDNPEENQRHKETLEECQQMQGSVPRQQVQNNPYLQNDTNLIQAMQYFNLEQDKQYIKQHSARHTNNQNTHHSDHKHARDYRSREPEVIAPQNASNWCNDGNNKHNNYNGNHHNHVQTPTKNKNKHFANTHPNQETINTNTNAHENGSIMIKSDNPYHPTNFYANQEAEQNTAVDLVNKYRIAPKDGGLCADAVQNEYAQFMYSVESMKDAQSHGYRYNDAHDYKNIKYRYNGGRSPRKNIGIDDMIPGQEKMTSYNFHSLQKGDTVWIRNDDGDWEIFTVLLMEKTVGCYNRTKRCYEETFVGTFKTGDREQRIWQKQTDDEFIMARYIKEKESINVMEDLYAINNIFKLKMKDGTSGNFVLKAYEEETGIAALVCVKTGERMRLDLNDVEHSIIGN